MLRGPVVGDWHLEPLVDVALSNDCFEATSPAPWLRLVGQKFDALPGRFVEIIYRASLWDEPVRPVFRFRLTDGRTIDRIAAGPIVGAGLWIGRVPHETVQIEISPTHRVGPFDFEIERIRRRTWPVLLAAGVRHRPRQTRSAILTRLIGWRPESDVNLAWAIGATPLGAYSAWRTKRERPLDLSGMDRPRFDWASAPPIHIVIRRGSDVEASRETIAALERQIFPSWRATILGSGLAPTDARVAIGETFEPPSGVDLVAVIDAGDVLLPNALAIVAEQAHRHPAHRLFYGDLLRRHGDGAALPVLQPGWSPRRQAARPLDGPLFVRGFARWSPADQTAFVENDIVPPVAANAVKALRRMLVETSRPERPSTPSPRPAPTAPATAAVIIPTRDQPARLARAIASLRASSSPGRFQIVVIDNGSVGDAMRRLVGDLEQQPDVRVVAHPGPFNFSLMCNEAAAASHGDVLVFLNDDTRMMVDGGLERLVQQALAPNTGAVGARLTYPDGRLQHVGVLLGMGGSAGHFGALAPGDDPGWAGRNLAVHEVSAVTGACLAVARQKFDAVGGFDAEHLPIELSDVDLCLKLNERGWQTILDPSVHLLHEESVSRGGATLRRLDVYESQRTVFLERWAHVLRDDPVFHPGLSLYSLQAALG